MDETAKQLLERVQIVFKRFAPFVDGRVGYQYVVAEVKWIVPFVRQQLGVGIPSNRKLIHTVFPFGWKTFDRMEKLYEYPYLAVRLRRNAWISDQ